MKGIVITPENDISEREFAEPVEAALQKAVGGYFDIIHPCNLPRPYCMLVDDDGFIKNNPQINLTASMLYGYFAGKGNDYIVGSVVILKVGETDEGMDIMGLDDAEIEILMVVVKGFRDRILAAVRQRLETYQRTHEQGNTAAR